MFRNTYESYMKIALPDRTSHAIDSRSRQRENSILGHRQQSCWNIVTLGNRLCARDFYTECGSQGTLWISFLDLNEFRWSCERGIKIWDAGVRTIERLMNTFIAFCRLAYWEFNTLVGLIMFIFHCESNALISSIPMLYFFTFDWYVGSVERAKTIPYDLLPYWIVTDKTCGIHKTHNYCICNRVDARSPTNE